MDLYISYVGHPKHLHDLPKFIFAGVLSVLRHREVKIKFL